MFIEAVIYVKNVQLRRPMTMVTSYCLYTIGHVITEKSRAKLSCIFLTRDVYAPCIVYTTGQKCHYTLTNSQTYSLEANNIRVVHK